MIPQYDAGVAWKRKRCKQYSTSHLKIGGRAGGNEQLVCCSRISRRDGLRAEGSRGCGGSDRARQRDRLRRKQSAQSHSLDESSSTGRSEARASGAQRTGTVHLPGALRADHDGGSQRSVMSAIGRRRRREFRIEGRAGSPRGFAGAFYEPAVKQPLRLSSQVWSLQPLVIMLAEPPNLTERGNVSPGLRPGLLPPSLRQHFVPERPSPVGRRCGTRSQAVWTYQ